jgi:hypothetical protein
MYFFSPITPETTLIVSDLPPYIAGRLTVAITAPVTAQCGTLAVGDMIDVGELQYGARLGITDYSRKENSEYGSITLVERPYAKRFDVSLLMRNTAIDYVSQRLSAIRATPVVWIGSSDYSALIAYGWLKDWGINITYPQHSEASLTIEGLV